MCEQSGGAVPDTTATGEMSRFSYRGADGSVIEHNELTIPCRSDHTLVSPGVEISPVGEPTRETTHNIPFPGVPMT